MKKLFQIPALSLILSLVPYPLLFAQDDDQSGGGESAAEASVTGAASQPSSASSGSVESNPVVAMVRSGIPVDAASQIKISNIKKLASAGVNAFKVIAKQAAAGDITVADLDSSVEKLDISTLATISKGKSSNLNQAIKDVASGNKDPSEIKAIADSGDFDNAYDLGSDVDLSIYNTISSLSDNVELVGVAVQQTGTDASSLEAMSTAVTWVDSLLKDRSISTSLPAIEVDLSSLTSSRYTYELVRLLSNYGALGPN